MQGEKFRGREGERCELCVFFAAQRDPTDLRKSGTQGECRRMPPIMHPIVGQTVQGPVVTGFISPWPTVKAELWCGEGEHA